MGSLGQSDHNLILFDVTERINKAAAPIQAKASSWNTRRLNRQKLDLAIKNILEENTAKSAIALKKVVSNICNKAGVMN